MKRLFWALCAGALLQSCGGGSGGTGPADAGSPQSCSVDAQRSRLDAWMRDQYYWYKDAAQPDIHAADMPSYFASQLAQPVDRYSFAQSTASFDQVLITGWRYGYGYAFVWDAQANALRVRTIEPQSPAAAAGMKRGDVVLSVDGHSPQEVLAGTPGAVETAGIDRQFVLRNADGSQRQLTVRSALFPLTPLARYETLPATRAGQPITVGYVAYHQFTDYSFWDMALAMQNLANAGVQELVVDLRYNSGGSIVSARHLASFIAGSRMDGDVFTHLHFNDKHPELDQDVLFTTTADRFTKAIEGLQRVIVITSRGTASASELVINGLRPYLPVVLIGDTTFGKPYGFVPRSDCGITYNAVNLETVNALGVGGYSDGLPADCPAPDDLDHELGDANERRLHEALAFIANGRCSSQAPQSAPLSAVKPKPAPVAGETVPEQMFLPR